MEWFLCARYSAIPWKSLCFLIFLNNSSGVHLDRDEVIWCHTASNEQGQDSNLSLTPEPRNPLILPSPLCKPLSRFYEYKQVYILIPGLQKPYRHAEKMKREHEMLNNAQHHLLSVLPMEQTGRNLSGRGEDLWGQGGLKGSMEEHGIWLASTDRENLGKLTGGNQLRYRGLRTHGFKSQLWHYLYNPRKVLILYCPISFTIKRKAQKVTWNSGESRSLEPEEASERWGGRG